MSCCLWYKDTNLKANHNLMETIPGDHVVVAYGTKILI